MLLPTKREKKKYHTPFVLQLANNNLDNWKQMFLLLSHEFHSSLPNAVPCRVEEIKSEDSEPFTGQESLRSQQRERKAGPSSLDRAPHFPGKCHHFPE